MTMLRDIALVENGRLESTDERVGVLASEIPAGFALPAFLLNDIDAGAPGRLYALKLLTLPAAGLLMLDKAGAGSFRGAPAGTYTGIQQVEKFDPGVGLVSRGTGSYTIEVGAAGTDQPPTVRTVSVRLGDENGPAANLTDLMVSFHAAPGPHASGLAIYQSETETTDANAVLSFTVSDEAIGIGDFGLISVLHKDGHNFLGLVAVA